MANLIVHFLSFLLFLSSTIAWQMNADEISASILRTNPLPWLRRLTLSNFENFEENSEYLRYYDDLFNFIPYKTPSLYHHIEESIKDLRVNLTFKRDVIISTRRGLLITNNAQIESYGIKRINWEKKSQFSEFSTTDISESKEEFCSLLAENVFSCERISTLNVEGKRSFTVIFTTQYQSSEEEGNRTVYEVAHELKLIPDDSAKQTLNITEELSSWFKGVVQPFHQIHVHAEVDSTEPVGIMLVSDDCDKNRSAGEDCQASYYSFLPLDDTFRKAVVFLELALMPVFEQNYPFRSKDYSIAGMKERKFPNNLMYWEEMKNLDLSFADLSSIDDDYFKEVSQLRILRLAGNGFKGTPEGIHILEDLEELDLSSNPLESMSSLSKVLQYLKKLKKLDLSNVPVRKLDQLYAGFAVLKLHYLNLRSSELGPLISETTKDIFETFTELKFLDMSENPISVLDKNLFSDLGVLKYLILSNANLSHSFPLKLSNAANINVVDLSHNKLTNMPLIDTCGLVKVLTADHNLIEEWEKDVFQSPCKNRWLNFLNISYNDIKTLSSCMIQSMDNIYVDLGQNPIRCDCNFKKIRKSLSSHNILNLGTAFPIACVQPVGVNDADCSTSNLNNFYWLLMIPVAIGLILIAIIKICTYQKKYEIAYLEHIDNMKKENRKKAEQLSIRPFEHDVYIVHSEYDGEWVRVVLLPRLEKYKVLFGDPAEYSAKDEERINENIKNSRHVLFVISEKFLKSKFCMHGGLDLCNVYVISGGEVNMIFLLRAGVNAEALPINLRYLNATYDSIKWPEQGKSDRKVFKKLVCYLGAGANDFFKMDLDQGPHNGDVRTKCLRKSMHIF